MRTDVTAPKVRMSGPMPRQIITYFLFVAALIYWPCMVSAQLAGAESISLMQPDGRFRVGHVMMDWTDNSRREPATSDPSDLRQVPIQIWYPARDDVGGKHAAYRPRIEAFRAAWGDETVDFMNAVRTSWIEAADISEGGPYCVFIFSHGWGARSSSHGTFLSNLASHGYIVIGLNHPYMGKVALSNGEITEPIDSQFPNQEYANRFYADDVIFVLDQLSGLNKKVSDGRFTGAIDMDRIAAGGHSSGFPAVSGAAARDNRIRGLISFDSGVPKIVRQEGLDVPILLFRADSASYTDLFFRGKYVHPKGTIYDVNFFRVHRGDFYDLVISGTTHSSVYDEYLFAEDNEERELSKRNHKIIGRYAVAFLDKILKETDSSLPDNTKTAPHTTLRVIKARRR